MRPFPALSVPARHHCRQSSAEGGALCHWNGLKAHLATNHDDAGEQRPEAGQSAIAGSVVPESRGRALKPIDERNYPFHGW